MTLTNVERLRLAVNTRQYATVAERDIARALCHAAIPQPHGLGLITVHTSIPVTARIRVWMPLAIAHQYGNDRINQALAGLQEAGALTVKVDGAWWIAALAPLVLPVVSEEVLAA